VSCCEMCNTRSCCYKIHNSVSTHSSLNDLTATTVVSYFILSHLLSLELSKNMQTLSLACQVITPPLLVSKVKCWQENGYFYGMATHKGAWHYTHIALNNSIIIVCMVCLSHWLHRNSFASAPRWARSTEKPELTFKNRASYI